MPRRETERGLGGATAEGREDPVPEGLVPLRRAGGWTWRPDDPLGGLDDLARPELLEGQVDLEAGGEDVPGVPPLLGAVGEETSADIRSPPSRSFSTRAVTPH